MWFRLVFAAFHSGCKAEWFEAEGRQPVMVGCECLVESNPIRP